MHKNPKDEQRPKRYIPDPWADHDFSWVSGTTRDVRWRLRNYGLLTILGFAMLAGFLAVTAWAFVSVKDKSEREEQLMRQFQADVVSLLSRAKSECSYDTTSLEYIVSQSGALATTRSILGGDTSRYDSAALARCLGSTNTLEGLVTAPKYKELFSRQEIEQAKERLRSLGF